MITTVLFDMHGVILPDPHGGLVPFIHKTFPDRTHEEIYKWWMKGSVGEVDSRTFFGNLGYPNPEEAKLECLSGIAIDPDFHPVAAELRKRYKTVLLTNELAEWGGFLIDKFRLRDCFDLLVVSGAIAMRKPEPRIFTYVLDQMGVPADECVFIDDMTRQLAGADSVGMHCLHYKGDNSQYPSPQSLWELPALLQTL